MRAFLNTQSLALKLNINRAEYLVVDLEMTGLDAKKDAIISIGCVPIRNGQIIHSDAGHWLIKQDNINLQGSAPIHKIRDIDLLQGQSLNEGLDALLALLAAKVLVVHHAPLDLGFLNQACLQVYGVPLSVDTIDTLNIERRRHSHNGQIVSNSLRLDSCRRRYNLPTYHAHNAVTDAIATAELWLAQMAYSSPKATLKDFI